MPSTSYITALRFPLAVLVVFIHNSYTYISPSSWASSVGYFGSRLLPAVAVPLFFCISGYLFFLNTERFTPHVYLNKLHRRCYTLLIPFTAWNLIAFGLTPLKQLLGSSEVAMALSPNIFWGCRTNGSEGYNWLGWFIEASTAPAQLPLWFVRDLIVISLCSPIIWFLLHKAGKFGLLLPAILYYGQLWPNLGGLSITGFWFFSLGAWFSIQRIDVVTLSSRLSRWLCLPMLIALLLPLYLPPETQAWATLSQSVYVLLAMPCAITLAQRFSLSHTPSRFWADSCFFVYASHTILLFPLLTLLKQHATTLSPTLQIGCYLLCPLLVIGLCLAGFGVLRKVLPHHSWWLTATGRRTR